MTMKDRVAFEEELTIQREQGMITMQGYMRMLQLINKLFNTPKDENINLDFENP